MMPYLLTFFTSYLESSDEESDIRPLTWVILLFVAPITQSVVANQFNGGMVSALYITHAVVCDRTSCHSSELWLPYKLW